jgi:glycosyltransferase involved in cell wall biosynthesis
MKILLIHKHFWPDTPPYATILFSIAKQLASDGHQVRIFSSHPNYKSVADTNKPVSNEEIDGIQITRIKIAPEHGGSKLNKLINFFYFPLRVFLHIVRKQNRADVVMCSTVPPVLIGFCCAAAAKLTGTKFLYHCMDLYPEIGRISGEFKNKFIYQFLLFLDKQTCRLSNRVIVLSQDMKQSLAARGLDNRKIDILNNFPINDASKPPDGDVNPLLKPNGKFRVLFAGNIGRFQNLESYVTALAKLKESTNLELVFLGEGAKLQDLKDMVAQLKIPNIIFIPHQSVGTARLLIANADLGIVSLSPDVYKYAYPSKTMTYLELGCNVLSTVEKESELAQMLLENNLGYLATAGQPDSICDAITRAMEQIDDSSKRRCREFIRERYSEKKMLGQWSTMFFEFTKADK